MKKFKGIKTSIAIGIILIIGIIFFSSTVESKIEGFPVPLMARYIYDKDAADYQYEWFCFEHDLPFLYKRAIKSKGWDQIFHDGDMRVFKKGDRTVVLIHHTQDGNIYLYESTKKDALKGSE